MLRPPRSPASHHGQRHQRTSGPADQRHSHGSLLLLTARSLAQTLLFSISIAKCIWRVSAPMHSTVDAAMHARRLPACLPACLSACLLSVGLSVCRSVGLSVFWLAGCLSAFRGRVCRAREAQQAHRCSLLHRDAKTVVGAVQPVLWPQHSVIGLLAGG